MSKMARAKEIQLDPKRLLRLSADRPDALDVMMSTKPPAKSVSDRPRKPNL